MEEGVEAREEWMHQNRCTHPEIANRVTTYILLQGERTMAGLGPMPVFVQLADASQGMLGWRKFMEEKVLTNIAGIRQSHCAATPCMMNGDNLMRHFISNVLHITHSQ